MKHPIQPLRKDEQGVIRFKPNAIVRYLLDKGQFDMNHLAMQDFSQEDREQFAQLIGYSLSGFGDLSYVSDETYAAASSMANIDEKLINALASLRKCELGITETVHIIYVLTAVGVPVDLDRLLVWIRQNFRFPLLDVDDDESWQEFCEHFKERVRNGR